MDFGGGAEVYFKLFLNMIMYHINLKLTTLVANKSQVYHDK